MPLNKISRRKILQATGLAAAAGLISACNNGGSPEKPAESSKIIKKKNSFYLTKFSSTGSGIISSISQSEGIIELEEKKDYSKKFTIF